MSFAFCFFLVFIHLFSRALCLVVCYGESRGHLKIEGKITFDEWLLLCSTKVNKNATLCAIHLENYECILPYERIGRVYRFVFLIAQMWYLCANLSLCVFVCVQCAFRCDIFFLFLFLSCSISFFSNIHLNSAAKLEITNHFAIVRNWKDLRQHHLMLRSL